ncbi:MAG: DNA polymerase Y family protein [Polyangiaceae bacterium]
MTATEPSPTPRRIAAIVLPGLACELARIDGLIPKDARTPFAVIVHGTGTASLSPRATLDAVDPLAWRYGARPGQTTIEANAFVSRLKVVRVPATRIEQALSAVAELATAFGTTAAIRLDDTALDSQGNAKRMRRGTSARRTQSYPAGMAAGPSDTVWLDVTGCARLQGGEDLLCAELGQRVAKLGHVARVAIANGPRIAQAVARWCGDEVVVPPQGGCRAMSALPIAALPISSAVMSWFGKLGLLRVDDLAGLDRARLAHRLGPQAQDLLDLIGGRDPLPLTAYHAPRQIRESACFDEPIDATQPLMFVLRGLVSRAVARLNARGEACGLAKLDLTLDGGVIAIRDVKSAAAGEYAQGPNSRPRFGANDANQGRTQIAQHFPTPLHNEAEIIRALHAKLERARFAAPITSLTLTLDALCESQHTQLNLSSDPQERLVDPQALAGLLAELSGWVGKERVGVLSIGNSHRPEAQSRLVPATPRAVARNRRRHGIHRPTTPQLTLHGRQLVLAGLVPTRLLPSPIPVGPLRHGSLLQAHHHLYNIDQLRMTNRIDGAHWWSSHPVRRDYAHAWLHSDRGDERRDLNDERRAQRRNDACGSVVPAQYATPQQYSEAWVFVDRSSRRAYLHGWFE